MEMRYIMLTSTIENSIFVYPSLAVKIGLKEAIFLQEVHHLLCWELCVHEQERKWVCKTIKEWCELYPFWSESTIKRIIKRLEKRGLLLSIAIEGKYSFNKRKAYPINYDRLHAIEPRVPVNVEK